MKSGKTKYIIIAVVIAAIVAAAAFIAISKTNNQSSEALPSTEDTETFRVVETDTEALTTETVSDTAAETENTEAADAAAGSSGTAAGSNSTASTGTSSDTTTTPKTVSFPYNDLTSGLSVISASSYEGVFLEDGSDEDISDVAVIILENTSGKDMEYAQITLVKGDETYEFDASGITAGAEIVVQEKDKKTLPDGDFDTCTIAATEGEDFEMSEDQITVEETEDGALEVTNISGKDIVCVRVFYKFYSEEDKAYVGGITYTAKITDLGAGESVTVNPSHYVSGYSQVVMVRTYDTAED